MADRARGLTTTFAARARNTPSPDDAPNHARRPGPTRETRDSALSVDTAPARPYRVSALIHLRDGAPLMPPLPLPTSPRPLSPGRALGLLVAANLADEGRGTIRAACLHRVLIVEVRQPGAGAYRSAPSTDVRVFVEAVEPVRSDYLRNLDLHSLTWHESKLPEDDAQRVEARLAKQRLTGLRVRCWAVEEVAEIAWNAPKASWEGAIGIASERHRIDLLGTQPARWLSRDLDMAQRAQHAAHAGWGLTGVLALAAPYSAAFALTPALVPLLSVSAGFALTTSLLSAWLARRVPRRMRSAASPIVTSS